ncbi:S41 family peptidase [Novosphingopyxis sp. YJ-S2-01]|uniref:S41 family peptidase n=1 Tax=Novosphingopyxis sp. YJ-S2-01 TaxID=2794021 RepID=UPI0018DCF02A|nr:S41 family peptidase [Novosphingopyxis sp. YJ-S2-01]MBH9537711.1 hypothetical protein [Novosphingopyxis sp. YJ-S2-01]
MALRLQNVLFRFALVAFLLFSVRAIAQENASASLRDFDFVIDIVETDYAGFPTKTEGEKRDAYERAKKSARAAIAADPDTAVIEIRNLLGWFEDGHLGLSGPPSGFPSAVADRASLEPGMSRTATEEDARRAYRKDPASIAGIWSTPNRSYELAIVPSELVAGTFDAVVLSSQSSNWAPGDIKARLDNDREAIWWMGDRTERKVDVVITDTAIRFVEIDITLIRDYPDVAIDRDRIVPADSFFLRQLSPETLWLRLPDFASEHRVLIETLLLENDELIRSTPNLIVDLRNNRGGGDSSYDRLMSYLYTRPIYSVGVEFRNTARNRDGIKRQLETLDLPPSSVEFANDLLRRMRASSEDWVASDTGGVSIETYPEVMPLPRRVGILAAGAGSSGDQFAIDSRFSRKVTLFGGPTAGVIDYSNVVEAPLPSNANYLLRWPTSRSQRLPEEPLDNVGVQPDVPFGPEVIDPVGRTKELLESAVLPTSFGG